MLPSPDTGAVLEETATSVFSTMLGLEVAPAPVHDFRMPDWISGAVQFDGGAPSLLVLETSAPVACRLTGRFLSMTAPAEITSDVLDVVGELVNIIGGNVKSVLAPGAALSVPSVIHGVDYTLRLCHWGVEDWYGFHCPDGEFRIGWLSEPLGAFGLKN